MSKYMEDYNKQKFYDRFADKFDSEVNMYDTVKRLEVIYGELLTADLAGLKLLDAGSGTGWFSREAKNRGAIVTSLDIGPNLLAKVRQKCDTELVAGSIMSLPFKDEEFDVVVSSEVIEHTPDPKASIMELARVLKPKGVVVVTTPNKNWKFAINIANALNLRPYDGYENWISWREFEETFLSAGLKVQAKMGIHMFPFVFSGFNPVLDYLHRWSKPARSVMLNMAIMCTK